MSRALPRRFVLHRKLPYVYRYVLCVIAFAAVVSQNDPRVCARYGLGAGIKSTGLGRQEKPDGRNRTHRRVAYFRKTFRNGVKRENMLKRRSCRRHFARRGSLLIYFYRALIYSTAGFRPRSAVVSPKKNSLFGRSFRARTVSFGHEILYSREYVLDTANVLWLCRRESMRLFFYYARPSAVKLRRNKRKFDRTKSFTVPISIRFGTHLLAEPNVYGKHTCTRINVDRDLDKYT